MYETYPNDDGILSWKGFPIKKQRKPHLHIICQT